MKAVAAFLLVLCYLSISHGWNCGDGPQLNAVTQIDAGQGKVVARDSSSRVYFLSGSSWYRLGTVFLKHVSVGAAGIWGVDNSNRVYKYVAGNFVRSYDVPAGPPSYLSNPPCPPTQLSPSEGLSLQQVDAGGLGQVVGVTSSDSIHCLRSNIASTFKQVSTLKWDNLPGALKYFSCSPLNGCWGVNSQENIYFTTISPTSCAISDWIQVPGAAIMVEVGNDGSVFVVNSAGHIYQRTGISSTVPQGSDWVRILPCLTASHVSYDLGRLWVVSKDGVILQCHQ